MALSLAAAFTREGLAVTQIAARETRLSSEKDLLRNGASERVTQCGDTRRS